MGGNRPLILYIPEKDIIQEAVDSKANMLKLILPHKVELPVPVWSKGTPSNSWCMSSRLLTPSGRKAFRTLLRR